MLRRRENMARVIDADRIVGRRMEDQQRFAQIADMRRKFLFSNVIEQRAANAERPAGKGHFHFTFIFDLSHPIRE